MTEIDLFLRAFMFSLSGALGICGFIGVINAIAENDAMAMFIRSFLALFFCMASLIAIAGAFL